MNVCLWNRCSQNSGIQRSGLIVVSFLQTQARDKKNLTPWKVPVRVNVFFFAFVFALPSSYATDAWRKTFLFLANILQTEGVWLISHSIAAKFTSSILVC